MLMHRRLDAMCNAIDAVVSCCLDNSESVDLRPRSQHVGLHVGPHMCVEEVVSNTTCTNDVTVCELSSLFS